MKIALITDAWRPQINGVVTTLTQTCQTLHELGHQVETFTPDQFRNWPCPSYPEIRLALGCGRKLRQRLDAFAPDAIHIATEGPLGLAARSYCLRRGLAYTTSFHTRFAEYIELRFKLPARWSYAYLRWFHSRSKRVMVATPSLIKELQERGFNRLALWSRGVDTERFQPRDKAFLDLPHPVFVYAGRVAIEKNIDAFLRLDLPGSKLIIGDGPQHRELRLKYPDAHFVGYQTGEELARYLAVGDVFVFPSRTDTFGLVMLEALACGIPVAGFPVQGPQDVIRSDEVGCLNEDLQAAALAALQLYPGNCRQYALGYSWRACTHQFETNLVVARQEENKSRSVWWLRHL